MECTSRGSDSAPKEHGEQLFYPPLWQQRRHEISKILDQHQPTRVLDLGTGEGALLLYLKHTEYIRELVGLDVDTLSLHIAAEELEPLISDYVSWSHPLTIKLYEGSVTQSDERFVDFDAATCVEVVEHLVEEELAAFPQSVFGRMKPRLMIITTPNAEYNVLLPSMESKFRHPDHKFEWTRAEFQNWCNSVASTYNYSVSFTGVGSPPLDRQDVGFCTQIAVFIRNEIQLMNDSENNREALGTPYKLIEEIKYPYRPPEVVPIEEQIRIEINLLYRLWCTCEIIDDGDYLDLNRLLSVESIKPLVTSLDMLRTMLEQFPQQFEFNEDKTGVKPVTQYSDDEDDDYV